MLSDKVMQESMIRRLEQVVSSLMEERPVFKQKLDYDKTVKYLGDLIRENLPFEEFEGLCDRELKENCSFVMSTEVMSGLLEDFTPEEISVFEGAIARQ